MCDSCCEQLESFTHKTAVSTRWPVWEFNRDLLRILADTHARTHTHSHTQQHVCLLKNMFPCSCMILLMLPVSSLTAPPCSLSASLPWCGGALPLLRPARVRLMNSIHQSPVPLIAANPPCRRLALPALHCGRSGSFREQLSFMFQQTREARLGKNGLGS